MINEEARADWRGNDPLMSDMDLAANFLHLDDAHAYVEAFFNNTLAFLQNAELSLPVTQEQKDAAEAQHYMLCCALRSSCDALNSLVARGADGSDKKAVAVLRLYHTLLSVRLSINVSRQAEREILFDELEQKFIQMLEYCRVILKGDDNGHETTAREPIYSSGLGIVMPLHMIAARCRNPSVRQGAVDMLLQARRREGLWDSTLVEKIVSTTIKLEQSQTFADRQQMGFQASSTVPGNARIREVKICFEGERSARIAFIMVGQWKNEQKSNQRFIQW
jgi:hypothetical protein